MNDSAAPSTPRETEAALITHKTPVYRLTRTVTRAVYAVCFPIRVEGRAHLPEAGGVMIVANHQSFLDIPLIAAAVPRHVSFVARDSLARARWLAYVMHQCGAVLVQRGKGDRSALRAIVAHLAAGDAVAMFPEGTRSSDGSVQAFHGGALICARQAGVPLVPAAIDGSYRAWPRDRKWPRPTRLAIRFGAPIDSAQPDALESARAEIQRLLGTG